METPKATVEPGKGFDKLPEALSHRRKAIDLSDGGIVVVEKWSSQKFILVMDFIVSAVKDMPLDALKIGVSDSKETAVSMFKVLGKKVMGLVDLSVREEDRSKLADLDAEELMDVLEAVVSLNLTEKLIKKVQGLTERFKQLSTVVRLTTPLK